MTYRHVIETLAQLPRIMYEDRKFSEADIEIRLDGVEVGLGFLRRTPIRKELGKGEGGEAAGGQEDDVKIA